MTETEHATWCRLVAMMPLSQIAGLAGTVLDRRSPVADAAADRWGYRPGVATWVRSSATHVFRVPGPEAATATATAGAYLRFIPARCRTRGQLAAVAGLLSRLADRGLAVVRPVPSARGQLVETVETALGPVHAMVVTAAPGESIEVDALTGERATAWGAALARLHRDGTGTGAEELPDWFVELGRPELFGADAALVDAVAEVAAALQALPRDPSRYGLVHGDFELDNLAWVDSSSVAYDFDEAGRSWFAADIAQAVRDLYPLPAATPAVGAAFGAFVHGYRQVRPLPETELASLPLFAAAHSATWLARLPAVLDAGEAAGDPAWLTRLRAKLLDHADRHRTRLLAHAR
jgi:Ser/Thr protein kinase RdoA (MazF antagonist)